MDEMTRYTGLSPAAFFTIAGMMVVVYRYVTGMFVAPEDYNKPPVVAAANSSDLVNKYFSPPTTSTPVQFGDMTEQELRGYDGSDPNKPLLMAIKAQIYDVSSSRSAFFLSFFLSPTIQIQTETNSLLARQELLWSWRTVRNVCWKGC